MTLDELRPGDVLTYWHRMYREEHSLHYARVVRVGKRFVTVEHERGGLFRKDPSFFDDKVGATELHPWHPDWRK